MSSLRDLAQCFALASYFGDVRRRSRAAGIDGLTPDAYARSLDQRLERLHDALLSQSWQPSQLLRIRQAKPDGRFRVLAIPTVEDRIVLELLRRGLEPIIEPILHDAAFAYRPRRSARTAVDTVSAAIERGATWVTLGDVRDFFDSVHIRPILETIDGLSADPALCRLLGKVLAHHAIQSGCGLAQGSSLSPLLSNLSLTPLDRKLHSDGFALVRYCDNLCVTTSSKEHASAALACMEQETRRLGLSLKPTASRVAPVESGFLWLGFWLSANGRRVSDGALQALASRANAAGQGIAPQYLSQRLEPIVRGWVQYFDASIPAEFHLGEHDGLLRQLLAKVSSTNAAAEPDAEQSPPLDAAREMDMDQDPWSWENHTHSTENDVVARDTLESLLGEADRLASEGQFEAAERSWEAAQRVKDEPSATNSTSELDEPLTDNELLDIFIGLFGARQDAFELLTLGADRRRQTAPMTRPLAPSDVHAHLLGRGALAIRPRLTNGSALLGVIDIDGTSTPVERNTLAYAQRLCTIARAWEWHVLLEITGGRGLHVWLPLTEHMQGNALHLALQSLVRASGPLPEGIAVEVLPAQDDAPDLHAQSMTLPLGVHVESGIRSRLFLADGTEITHALQGLASIRPTSPGSLTEYALIPSSSYETGVSRTDPLLPDWSRFGRSVERVMSGCALLRHLAEKARDIGHLTHAERLSLLHSLGHLDAPGEQTVHAIVGLCRNYDAAETSRQIANRRGLPVSCSRLREKHATPELLPHCRCDFGDVRHRGGYATPLLHAGAFRRAWRNVLHERRDLEVALKNDENVGLRIVEETVDETGTKLKGLPPHEWA